MKKTGIILLFLFISAAAFSQKYNVRGVVKDAQTGETLVGANVLLKKGVGTVTDLNGSFKLTVDQGTHNITISYVGYITQKHEITVNKDRYLEFELENQTINEVKVVADYARNRETPVAFTNVTPKKLNEELGGRDLPMILNSTPGVYATQQGGGDGDARITIRGFNQRNVAVMIDGIPVNDMENGWVYWSNWFGLDVVTRTMQVQRGLGASKLAIPSVGGTINILTKGIQDERELRIKQMVDNNMKLRTTLGFTSGQLKNGWGVTLAGSFKTGQAWVDKAETRGWFYYGKIDKRWGDHITSLTGYGAPQTHDQRGYPRAIATYDLDFAEEAGVDVDAQNEDGEYLYRPKINNMGATYNYLWGPLRRTRFDSTAGQEILNAHQNMYHKPQFSLRDFWTITDKLSLSNIFYVSLGKGGGVSPESSIKKSMLIRAPGDPYYGQIDWQRMYNTNSGQATDIFGQPISPVDPTYSDSLYRTQGQFLLQRRNEHYWYGWLSTFNYKINERLTMSGGLDLRSYKGIHYTEVYDLLGADYTIDKNDEREDYNENPKAAMKKEGDKIQYYNDGLVRWGGTFFQVEYSAGKISSFINLSGAYTGIKKVDYFVDEQSPWKWKPGFTVKGGLNYNLTERMNVFANLGYLSKVRRFQYFFEGYSTNFRDNLENQKVKAIEFGYHYGSPSFSANINAYRTAWENKPTRSVSAQFTNPVTDELEDTFGDIPGMDALHKGIEIDFVYKIFHNLNLQGVISLGDWTWDKKVDSLQMYYRDNGEPANVIGFDARGIHVGDAAQTQLGASVRYEPLNNLYFKTRVTRFARHYADFNPENTTDDQGNPVDSWKAPAYTKVNAFAGYRFTLDALQKTTFSLRFNIYNVLNTKHIADARNNDNYIQKQFGEFDAKSAAVFFGAPRQYKFSLQVQF